MSNYKTQYFMDLETVSINRYDMQFKFATKIWETRHNKKFTSGIEETKEICNIVHEISALMETA